ncbi:MAG: hypothetical protein ACFFAU_01585 [Candidatus Hodarchaeota archaeon]
MISDGNISVEKVKYLDGIGCCIWYHISKKNKDVGICWDFSYKDIDKIIGLLKKLKKIKPRVYKEKK